MYIVIYLKSNYKTFYRIYNSYPYLKEIGQVNGYGWEIIDIQLCYEKRFITLNTYKIKMKELDKKKMLFNSRIDKLVKVIDLLLND